MHSSAAAVRLRLKGLPSCWSSPRRRLSTSAGLAKQHLYWAGTVLDNASPAFQKVPKDWWSAVGAGGDAEQGLTFTNLSSSPTHSQIAYRTLDHDPATASSSLEDSAEEPQPAGLSKVFTVGRNVFAELGVGYSSQEATWGMVGPGFEGEKGVTHIATGLGTSWIVTGTEEGSNVYSFGNSSSGQLGLGESTVASTSGAPQLQIYSAPKRVRFMEGDSEVAGLQVHDIAVGMDHVMLLTSRKGSEERQVWTCGLNTDGQLGQGSPSTITSSVFQALKSSHFPAAASDPLVGVSAGADTSFVWTASGRVFSFGNSEYGQALHGRPIDRIDEPLEATEALPQQVGKVVCVRSGGSFSILLDEHGQVFTAGYGAIGQGSELLSTLAPALLTLPEPAVAIYAGLEYAAATTRSQRLFVWGLDSAAGRLGLGPRSPYPSFMLASRFTYDAERELRVYRPAEVRLGASRGSQERIVQVACGNEVMWVLTEDGEEEIGRWDAR